MSGRKPWTNEDTARLIELHGQGLSLHAIAKEMGRGKATISKYADAEGLSFDRGKTRAAAEAVHVDNKARRVLAETRLLDVFNTTLDKLDQPARVYSFGGADNRFAEEWFEDGPPPADRRALIQAAAAALTASNKLNEINSARHADAAKSALVQMREALTQLAEEADEVADHDSSVGSSAVDSEAGHDDRPSNG